MRVFYGDLHKAAFAAKVQPTLYLVMEIERSAEERGGQKVLSYRVAYPDPRTRIALKYCVQFWVSWSDDDGEFTIHCQTDVPRINEERGLRLQLLRRICERMPDSPSFEFSDEDFDNLARFGVCGEQRLGFLGAVVNAVRASMVLESGVIQDPDGGGQVRARLQDMRIHLDDHPVYLTTGEIGWDEILRGTEPTISSRHGWVSRTLGPAKSVFPNLASTSYGEHLVVICSVPEVEGGRMFVRLQEARQDLAEIPSMITEGNGSGLVH